MDFALPQLGEGLYEAEFIRWSVAPGDVVRRGQPLMDVMTDKATMEVPAPFEGVIEVLAVAPGERIHVGQLMLRYAPKGGVAVAVAASAKVEKRNGVHASVVAKPNGIAASPSVRHLARKLGVDLKTVRGSGPGGRVLLDDLPVNSKPSAAVPSRIETGRPGESIPYVGIRRRIGEHLLAAQRQIPTYTYVDECDVTELVRLRDTLKEPMAKKGSKLTYMPFIVKAVTQALQRVPLVNASLDMTAEQIVCHPDYNIGIATATDHGLLVPVLRNAEKRSVPELAKEIDRLAQSARVQKLTRDESIGGTFTITSIGNFGGIFATPIVHHPQVGILAVGKIVKRPVYDDFDRIQPAWMVYLCFSFDHRVVDGAVAATFANHVMDALRNPAALLLLD